MSHFSLSQALSALSVGKFLLNIDRQTNLPELTHLRLQLLTYYAHVTYCYDAGRPLIDEQIYCSHKGPYIPSLGNAYGHLGHKIIATNAPESILYDADEHIPHDVQALLRHIWDGCGALSTRTLMLSLQADPIYRQSLTHGQLLNAEQLYSYYHQATVVVPFGVLPLQQYCSNAS